MPPASNERASRARPVADAPVAALVADAEDVAKAWLVELVAGGPLAGAASLPLDAFAREAPVLCAAVARALGDDVELARLQPRGDLAALAGRAGALAGAGDAATTVAAVDALRRAVWDAALGELGRPSGALVADLADRLAAVCSLLVAAALAVPPVLVESEQAPDPEPEPTVRVPALRVPLVRPARPPADDLAPPRVADGDPHTHLAARAAEFVQEGRPFAVLL